MKKHYLVTVDVPESATEHPEEIIIDALEAEGYGAVIQGVDKTVYRAPSRIQDVKCDMCGEIIRGRAIPVYNENQQKQRGIVQCLDCFKAQEEML